MQTISTGENYPGSRPDDGYEQFSQSIVDRFDYVTMDNKPLFTTNATGLWEAYLNNLPAEARQHYNCHACRRFIERYCGLVYIDDDGTSRSAMVADVPDFFYQSALAMTLIVNRSKVNGVFITDKSVLGTPTTGDWHHLHALVRQPFRSALLSSSQVMAERREEFKMLVSGLRAYPVEAVDVALKLLRSDSLYRSEKVLGVAEWLKDVHTVVDPIQDSVRRTNLIWRYAATAPVGFCHISSSMIGTLLDDIVAGLSFEAVSWRFSEKMHPLQYQRPQAAPTAGNIKQAEEIVAKLGIERSLERRYARVDEIQAVWRPKPAAPSQPAGGGVFGHLKAKGTPNVRDIESSPQTITWVKFVDTVLPDAEMIEVNVPRRGDFAAILTATHPDAPPVIQWDLAERRNPFSWYLYNGGSYAENWEVHTGWNLVSAITMAPSMWANVASNQGKAVMLVIDGARDSRHETASLCLFPEILKSDLRQVRATIEAYNKTKHPTGYSEASACGLWLQSGQTWSVTVRVKTSLGTVQYRLDRWD